MAYVGLFSCWLAVGVFGTAAIGKVRRFGEFAESVAALRIVPGRVVRPVAVGVVAVELTIVALCAVPWAPFAPAGLLLGAGVLVIFAVAAMSARLRNRVVPCRCFGKRGVPLGGRQAARNGLLAVLLAAGLTTAPAPGGGVAVVVTGLIAMVVVLLVVAADDLIDLLRVPARSSVEG